MTSDPKAPGADAVILNYEEKEDDVYKTQVFHARIKVLTDKGKEAATIRIPYERGFSKVSEIKGRTIHSDGAVVPMTATPADLMDVKTKNFQINMVVFTLPDVQVGSILEYRLEIRYDEAWVWSPNWRVQQKYFVHNAHYSFLMSNHLVQVMFFPRTKPGTHVEQPTPGRFAYDVTDVPPAPAEDWMPPLNSFIWHIEFYYSAITDRNQFWEEAGKAWAKNAEHFSSPNKTIQEAAAGIVASGDTEEVKARKLYDAVLKLENTSFTRVKTEAERKREKLKDIKSADDVWKEKSGTANELALLYVALARAAGLQAVPMQVVDRNEAIFDMSYFTLRQLDDYIAVVTLGGKDIFLDPGQVDCPFGLLHWKHTMAGGLRVGPRGAIVGQTPGNTYQQNLMQRIADLEIAPDGAIAGSIRFVMNGQQALHWRQMAIREDADEVKKRFNEWMHEFVPEGVTVDFDHFLALDDHNANLIGIVKVSGQLGSVTGKHVFLPGLLFESRAKHPFVTEDHREIPVDLHYPQRIMDDVTYRLPEGLVVESGPQKTTIPWADHAELRMASQPDKSSLRIVRSLAYNFTLLDPSDYGALHDFYQKVATADQQQVVLARAPANAP
jgi:hypothetical protein